MNWASGDPRFRLIRALRSRYSIEGMCAAVLLVCATVSAAAQSSDIPAFRDYSVRKVFHGKRAVPQVHPSDRNAFGYRTVLTDADKQPNFAGVFVVSVDTCGSDSANLLITDARSGKVHQGFCIFRDYGHQRPPGGLVEYRLDSSLLIAHGCFDNDKSPRCGDHYYRMTQRRLVEIRFIPFERAAPWKQ